MRWRGGCVRGVFNRLAKKGFQNVHSKRVYVKSNQILLEAIFLRQKQHSHFHSTILSILSAGLYAKRRSLVFFLTLLSHCYCSMILQIENLISFEFCLMQIPHSDGIFATHQLYSPNQIELSLSFFAFRDSHSSCSILFFPRYTSVFYFVYRSNFRIRFTHIHC